MKKMQNWLIDLNAITLGSEALENIMSLANQLKPKTIHFIHVAKKVELPADLKSEFPDLQQVEIKSQAEKVMELAASELSKEIEVSVTAKIGDVLAEILNVATENQSDLILTTCSASVITRVIKEAPCHVMVVPEKKVDVKSIFIPIDFSKQTELSMELVNALDTNLSIENVQAIHFYKDASYYIQKVCESPYEVEELIKERIELNGKLNTYSKHKRERFTADHSHLNDLKVSDYKVSKGIDPHRAVNEAIQQSNSQLIVLGAFTNKEDQPGLLGKVPYSMNFNDDKYYIVAKEGAFIDENKSLFKAILNFA
ncbi:universal stress protein [Fulvivirga lutea]|uniref:Universal stress protein n=1 Tax=Fulvivirga lutea TaxID=2810512 RepID=A0A975A2W1_9BACT|nr:universal stress protein [Fulvivirga lutea]QSE99266.1 universal stress protein [Fulvivirga lutea]